MKFSITFYLAFILLTSGVKAQDFIKVENVHPCIDADHTWGAYWIDYDNDGWQDIFVTNMAQNNRLYRNLGDGTFEKITNSILVQEGSLPGVIDFRGSTWADFDNDDDLDCFIATGLEGGSINNRFYINNGNGSFIKDTLSILVNDPLNSVGAAWVDYDNDGDLDLHVIGHATGSSTNLGEAVLYKNTSNSFSKVSGLLICTEVKNSNHSSWTDFDSDGDMDLFTPSHSTNNKLFKNLGNSSFELLTGSDVMLNGNGTSCGSWGDYDNDGDMDLYVTKLLSHPCFYQNNDGEFEKIEDQIITNDGTGVSSSTWFDCDNDGDLDLFVIRWDNFTDVNNSLYLNEGGNFIKETNSTIVVDETQNNGLALCDYDKDGDLDIYLCQYTSNVGLKNILYKNETTGKHWISLKCNGVLSNRSAIGTTVRVKANIDGSYVWQMRQVNSQQNESGQNSFDLHFGLGDATTIDSIMVIWPGGDKEYYGNIPADKFYEIVEGTGIIPVMGLDKKSELRIQIYPNPSNGIINISNNLSERKNLTLNVYTQAGMLVYSVTGLADNKIDLRHLNSGIYFLIVHNKEIEITKKILIR